MQASRYLLAVLTCFWPLLAQSQSSELQPVFTQISEDGTIRLDLGIAKLMLLDQPASTVIIGDTNIADTVLLDDQLLVFTAKQLGSTNLVVLAGDNSVIFQSNIIVGLSGVSEVNVRRGNTLQGYVCIDNAGCRTGTIPRLPDSVMGEDRGVTDDSVTPSEEIYDQTLTIPSGPQDQTAD